MPPLEPARHWYRVKRVLGCITGIVGGAMVLSGGTTVIVTVLSVPLTVATVGWIISQAGLALFGYGLGAKNQRTEDVKK